VVFLHPKLKFPKNYKKLFNTLSYKQLFYTLLYIAKRDMVFTPKDKMLFKMELLYNKEIYLWSRKDGPCILDGRDEKGRLKVAVEISWKAANLRSETNIEF
jgi:hypothetical protein